MEENSRVPALNRCFELLKILQNTPASMSELISLSGFPRSSCYLLVDEMCKLGLIKQNREGKYQLWMRLVALGQSALSMLDMREMIEPYLTSLVESTNCLAGHYGVMDGDKAYYVIKKTSPKSGLSIRSREGMEISLLHAGLGKCLLAFQDEVTRERILSTIDYTPATPTSITDEQAFRMELANIKLQGWAFDNSEGEAEIRCVAAPVFGQNNTLIGAISVTGLSNVFVDDALSELVKKVQQCALNINAQLK